MAIFEPPRTSTTARGLKGALNVNVADALLANGNFIANLHLEGRDIDLAAVDADVTVTHELTGLSARHGEAEPVR